MHGAGIGARKGRVAWHWDGGRRQVRVGGELLGKIVMRFGLPASGREGVVNSGQHTDVKY